MAGVHWLPVATSEWVHWHIDVRSRTVNVVKRLNCWFWRKRCAEMSVGALVMCPGVTHSLALWNGRLRAGLRKRAAWRVWNWVHVGDRGCLRRLACGLCPVGVAFD